MEIGDDQRVQCLVADFMRAAGTRWRVSLSARAVAQDVGIRHPTISQLVADKTERFDFGTLATLCTYFWCYPGEIIVRVTPMLDVPRLASTSIRRPQRPDRLGPVPRIIVKVPSLSLEDQRRLPRHTMTRLQEDIQRIDRDTLMAVCVVAECKVGDILQLEEPWPEE